MVYRGHKIHFDDITKAHLCIKTEVPSITSEQVYDTIVAQSEIDELNVKVTSNELADFIKDLAEEIRARKAFLASKNKMRKSDVVGNHEELKKVNVVALLPRTMSNQNLNTICNMLAFTVPLDIHFIIVLSDDTKEKVAEPIERYTYWSLNTDSDTLQHK